MLFRGGLNAKQVQMWLGHHSPAFTLATYVHLMPYDLPDPGFLDAITGSNAGATQPTENSRNREAVEADKSPISTGGQSSAEVAAVSLQKRARKGGTLRRWRHGGAYRFW
jgi:hypothetical protein